MLSRNQGLWVFSWMIDLLLAMPVLAIKKLLPPFSIPSFQNHAISIAGWLSFFAFATYLDCLAVVLFFALLIKVSDLLMALVLKLHYIRKLNVEDLP